MINPGVHHATEAARAVGGLVALPGLGRKADFWDLWSEHGTDITRERILSAKAPEPATSTTADAPAPAPTPPETKLPDGYWQDEKNLFFNPPKAKPEDAAPPPIRLGPRLDILARSRDGQSGEWGLLLAWADPDDVAHRWSMPYSMLSDARQIWATLSAGGYIPAPGKQARAMLAQLLATVAPPARARCVPGTGWHHGCMVLPDAVYGYSPERLIIQHPITHNPYRVAGDLAAWQETIGTWCRGNSRLTLAVGAALAGPLLSLVGMESGAVHIYGHSSSGKSTVLRAGWSVWGGPTGVRSWRATKVGMEEVAAIHVDTLLALDEIGQADVRVLEEAAYLLMNGQGKLKGRMTGGLAAMQSWTIMVLSTGEPTMADRLAEAGQQPRAGQEVRLVDVPADAGQGMGSWENLHGHATPAQFSDAIKAACTEHHGTLGRAWVEYLAAHQDTARDLRAVIRRTAEQWAAGAQSGQVVRVAERFALIGLAGEVATQAGLVPWTKGESLRAAQTCLNAWLVSRGGTGDSEDMQALATIRGYIARYGASRFQTVSAGAEDILTPGQTTERIVERAGFRRTTLSGEDQFIFTREQWAAIFAGRNPQQAARALDRVGLLARNDSSLAQKVALPDVGRVRAYVVRIAPDTGEGAP